MNHGGQINAYWIKEYGLYSFLTRSKMPYAFVFQDWLFVKVLPSIRRIPEKKYEEEKEHDIVMYKENDVSSNVNEIAIDPFECFEVDNENKLLKTPYGNVPYIYTNKGQPAFRAINITDILGYENGRQAIRVHVHSDFMITSVNKQTETIELTDRLENSRQLITYLNQVYMHFSCHQKNYMLLCFSVGYLR